MREIDKDTKGTEKGRSKFYFLSSFMGHANIKICAGLPITL
jgi:hypothetical protein